MPSLNNDNPQNDAVSQHLDEMYEELMFLRLKLGELRRKKINTPDEKEKKGLEIIELTETIENLNVDFKDMLKNHTDFWKYKKATGQTQANHSEKLLEKIRAIQSNMGHIVSNIPTNKQQ